MICRDHCGACCIAPSISSPIPGMPDGKPAGLPCIHLTPEMRCGIYRDPRRPVACSRFRADPQVCGKDRREALLLLAALERGTPP